MAKIVFLLITCGLCFWQVQTDRATCNRLVRVCQQNERIVGREDQITSMLNMSCRRRIPGWRNVTRCQLGRASCELSMLSCGDFNCENIARVNRR